METTTPEILEFDICGQICPACLLVALREINRNISGLKEGTVQLLIKTDNRYGTQTIPEAAQNMGLKVEVHKEGALYHILVAR